MFLNNNNKEIQNEQIQNEQIQNEQIQNEHVVDSVYNNFISSMMGSTHPVEESEEQEFARHVMESRQRELMDDTGELIHPDLVYSAMKSRQQETANLLEKYKQQDHSVSMREHKRYEPIHPDIESAYQDLVRAAMESDLDWIIGTIGQEEPGYFTTEAIKRQVQPAGLKLIKFIRDKLDSEEDPRMFYSTCDFEAQDFVKRIVDRLEEVEEEELADIIMEVGIENF